MSFVRHLKRLTESHTVPQVVQTLREAIEQKKVDPSRIHLAEMSRVFLGEDYPTAHRRMKAINAGTVHLLEASEAADASAFSNITGQLLVDQVKKGYDSPEFVIQKLFKKYPNPGANLKEHKVPYITDVLHKGEKLASQQPYPYTTFAESWITMPAPEKFGEMTAVSFEMAYSDLTGEAQKRAKSLGKAMGYLREERCCRVLAGIVNNHKWNDNALNTYVSTAGTGNYVNKLLSNTIANYTHVNDVEQLFYRMVDPITGRKIHVRPKSAVCMPEKRLELKRVMDLTTEVRDATSGVHNVGKNPLDTSYDLVTSTILQAIISTTTTAGLDGTPAYTALSASDTKQVVFFGDFEEAFGLREVYGLQAEDAPPNNPEHFNRDIVLVTKCGFFDIPFVYDPRFVAKSTAEGS